MAKNLRTRKNSTLSRTLSGLVTFVCVMVIVAGALYVGLTLVNRAHARALNDELRDMYHGVAAETAFLSAAVPEDETAPEGLPAAVQSVVSAERRSPDAVTLNATQSDALSLASAPAEDIFGMPIAVNAPIEESEPEVYTLQPGFEDLYKVNEDVVGWIQTGCGVDYPIVWSDNKFYLDHDFEGRSSVDGAIFLDARNVFEMTDDMLLIYGHNMKSGAMFGDMDDYRKASVMAKAPIITIESAWKDETKQYVYFSLFDASMNTDDPSYIKITHFNFEEEEERQAYVEEIQRRSMYKIPVEVDASDQIVVLVTCSYSQDNGRFLLFGRELREDETVEDIMAMFAGQSL